MIETFISRQTAQYNQQAKRLKEITYLLNTLQLTITNQNLLYIAAETKNEFLRFRCLFKMADAISKLRTKFSKPSTYKPGGYNPVFYDHHSKEHLIIKEEFIFNHTKWERQKHK